MTKKRVLTEYQLDRLKEHKYSSSGNTLLDPLMQHFWKWLVEQIPTTWAPNSITLTGLVANIVSTIFLMLYCPQGFGDAPSWCFILCAVGLFVYQSLDAIDGKQARRTSSSTPLGELFDHGCDAMSMVLIVVGAGISSQLGDSPYVFMVISLVAATFFYLAQWRTYTTRKMHFGIIDVTEGQWIVMCLYVITSFTGTAFWNQEVFGLQLKTICWTVTSSFASIFIFSFIYNVFLSQAAIHRNHEHAVARKDKAFVPYHLKPGMLLFLLWAFLFACSVCSRVEVMQNYTVLFIIFFGTICTKLSCLMLVSHMTRSEVALVDEIFLAPLLLLACQLFSIGDEFLCLIIATIFSLGNLMYYVVRVCSDICDHLDIYCFKITHITNPISNPISNHNLPTTS